MSTPSPRTLVWPVTDPSLSLGLLAAEAADLAKELGVTISDCRFITDRQHGWLCVAEVDTIAYDGDWTPGLVRRPTKPVRGRVA